MYLYRPTLQYNKVMNLFILTNSDKEEAEVLGLANLRKAILQEWILASKPKRAITVGLAFMYPRLLAKGFIEQRRSYFYKVLTITNKLT